MVLQIDPSRRTKKVVMTKKNRDEKKTFLIVEASSMEAEAWALRMMEAIGKSGAEIPEIVLSSGMAGLLALGARAVLGAPYSITGPLWEEMFEKCVHFIPDPSRPDIVRGRYGIGPMVENDVQEVVTRLHLRMEVLDLHLGFSLSAALYQKWLEAKAVLDASNTSNTQTSQETSE